MKYESAPHYHVEDREKKVSLKFDAAGHYETTDKDEITVLDSLVPTWVTKLDAEKAPAKAKSADK